MLKESNALSEVFFQGDSAQARATHHTMGLDTVDSYLKMMNSHVSDW